MEQKTPLSFREMTPDDYPAMIDLMRRTPGVSVRGTAATDPRSGDAAARSGAGGTVRAARR